MAQLNAIGAARSGTRGLIDGKDQGVALLQRYDMRPRLHPRALFADDELAALEIRPRLGEQNRDLKGEMHRAVQILVEAIIVACAVPEDQRRRPRLPRQGTLGKKSGMLGRIWRRLTQLRGPLVREHGGG